MFLELLKVKEKFTKDMTYSIIPNKCTNASLWLASPYNKGIDLWIFVRVVGMTCPIRPFISSCNFQWSLTKTYNSLHILHTILCTFLHMSLYTFLYMIIHTSVQQPSHTPIFNPTYVPTYTPYIALHKTLPYT